ncbi:hypothetical protein ABLE68_07150 [Nocardioides sp. CN2-186]|uniref:hypothetical protein n=1 Tax=Nocardioides tweenelious TaxID=3156607 RepID=UPI0032B53F76
MLEASGLIREAALQGLYDELEHAGDWYDIAPDDHTGAGRVVVQRVVCGEYVQNAEILRTADGRGWTIYADSQCPTCGREARTARRLNGTEIDIVLAVDAVVLELGAPPLARYQHLDSCSQARVEAEVEADDGVAWS